MIGVNPTNIQPAVSLQSQGREYTELDHQSSDSSKVTKAFLTWTISPALSGAGSGLGGSNKYSQPVGK